MKQQSILPFVTKPGRYLGKEFNHSQKPWEGVDLHCVLVFPDLYEIGMSHQGLQILYHILNAKQEILAERSYCPDIDVEKIMRGKNQLLSSLESNHSLNKFDIIGITLPYELCYTNILTILDLAHIPLHASDRQDLFPLIVGGGSGSMNPEPVAEFFDVILLGDGEEAILEIAEISRIAKLENWNKGQLLQKLNGIQGLYVPSFFQPQYEMDGRIKEIQYHGKTSSTVTRRILPDLDNITHLLHPLVPNARIVHDRLGIEIARGCTRGCRFCQAGMIYRPVRERTVEQVMEIAKCGLKDSGFEELALLSLSTGDYSCLESLLPNLMDNCAPDFVSVSMPSMRVGTLSQEVMDQIKRVRKTGFTVAPEAGSERLRQIINKGITEVDLLTTCRDAFSLGWTLIKLYFMIGLPTESTEDLDAIADLALKTKKEGDKSGQKRRQINVSLGTFVPKPHTPFQWQKQLSLEESQTRINYIKKIMPRKGIKLKWQDPKQSYLEGVFSRGDRRLTKLIIEAWNLGARLDSWSDYFNLNTWHQAASSSQIDMDFYLRQREKDEILPWQHLESGVDSSFLLEELDKAYLSSYTADCRYHGCHKCGLCDFKIIRPVVHEKTKKNMDDPPSPSKESMPTPLHSDGEDLHFKYRVSYSRCGKICYLGHLEILQVIFRTLRRAKITTNFSKGFNPSPKISFGPALPVGVESLAEYFIMDLPTPLKNIDETRNLLNENIPSGLEITGIELHTEKIPQNTINHYEITLPRPLTKLENQKLLDFIASPSFPIQRQRKGKTKTIDIRQLITHITIKDLCHLSLTTCSIAGSPGVKALEALTHILGLDRDTAMQVFLRKTGWEILNDK